MVEALGYTLTTAVLLLVVLYSLATGQDVVEALTLPLPLPLPLPPPYPYP